MKKKVLIAVALMAIVSAVGAFATTASAYPGVAYGKQCSNCHSGTGTNPTATLVSNNGTTATYNVAGGGLEWAVFNGGTRVGGQIGSTGQFSVPVGGTYTLFSVFAYPGPLGRTVVTPAAPAAQFTIMASAGPNGSISPGSLSVNANSNLTYTITPDPGFHIASVLVDGSSVGTVASYTFTNVTAGHTIAASFAMDVLTTHTIAASAGANGSIAPSGPQTVMAGSDAPFMIVAATGYHVADVLVDGDSVGAVGSYTFTNVQADHTIAASFAADVVGMFTITPSAGANGSISPAAVQTLAAGGNVTFSITPDSGYHIESIAVDGAVIATPANGSYAFTNVRADHTIMASFSNDVDVAAPTRISLRVNDASVRRVHSVRLRSALSNSVPALFFGTPVRYEVKRPGSSRWRLITVRMADTKGATNLRVLLTRRGAYRFRVRFLGTDDFMRSTSRTVIVRVR